MRILVIGAGGVGGYFGARLAEVGHKVVFAARGAHAQAMREKGLTVLSPAGDLHLPEVQILSDLAEPGTFDLALVCVKLADTEAAGELLKGIGAGPGTAVLSTQNGIEGEAILGRVLGRDDIIGGATYISAHIKEPGVIEHVTPHARIVFGELSGQETPRARAILEAFSSAKFESELVGDIETQLWRKFVLLAAFSGACTLRREDCGAIRDGEGRKLYEALIRETVAVGRAKGVPLEEDFEGKVMGNIDRLPAAMKPSMLIDLERGKPLELPWLSGAVARLGDELGVPTPASHEVAEGLADKVKGSA
ncbi:ketopantoate reductase family protein [Limibacillus halophilus]|jgi:2-dehydropantoate 2-reductase